VRLHLPERRALSRTETGGSTTGDSQKPDGGSHTTDEVQGASKGEPKRQTRAPQAHVSWYLNEGIFDERRKQQIQAIGAENGDVGVKSLPTVSCAGLLFD